MSTVVELNIERHRRKKRYLTENQLRMERFFAEFLAQHCDTDISLLTDQYTFLRTAAQDEIWDHSEFREDLKEAMAKTYGDLIWVELAKQFWFDPRWLSRDEALEQCTSFFILGPQYSQPCSTRRKT